MRCNPSMVESKADTQRTPPAMDRNSRASGSTLRGNRLTMTMKNASVEQRSAPRLQLRRISRQMSQRNMTQGADAAFMPQARFSGVLGERDPDPDASPRQPYHHAKYASR